MRGHDCDEAHTRGRRRRLHEQRDAAQLKAGTNARATALALASKRSTRGLPLPEVIDDVVSNPEDSRRHVRAGGRRRTTAMHVRGQPAPHVDPGSLAMLDLGPLMLQMMHLPVATDSPCPRSAAEPAQASEGHAAAATAPCFAPLPGLREHHVHVHVHVNDSSGHEQGARGARAGPGAPSAVVLPGFGGTRPHGRAGASSGASPYAAERQTRKPKNRRRGARQRSKSVRTPQASRVVTNTGARARTKSKSAAADGQGKGAGRSHGTVRTQTCTVVTAGQQPRPRSRSMLPGKGRPYMNMAPAKSRGVPKVTRSHVSLDLLGRRGAPSRHCARRGVHASCMHASAPF